jgi:hypothetical protein
VDVGLVELDAPAQTIIDNVLWWTRILKTAHVTASEWLATFAAAKVMCG